MKSLLRELAVLLPIIPAALAITPHVSDGLQSILANPNKSGLYRYPTDFTRGIIPKPIHSHNDYWRDIPFYSALSYGAVSVEADVWLINVGGANSTLLVSPNSSRDGVDVAAHVAQSKIGHEPSSLTPARTFKDLYVYPILDTLRRQNPKTNFVESSWFRNGVYDTSSDQTIYLWVDLKTIDLPDHGIKSDIPATWAAVLDELAPLKDAGYLTTTDGKTISRGPVTVIGTGATPKSYFIPDPASSSTPRFVFYDADLTSLDSGAGSSITNLITPIASTDFAEQFGRVLSEGLNSTQLALLRSQVGYAKSKGIGARYWDQPGWPIGTRNAVFRQLLDEGVALLNVDDLEGAADFWQSYRS